MEHAQEQISVESWFYYWNYFPFAQQARAYLPPLAVSRQNEDSNVGLLSCMMYVLKLTPTILCRLEAFVVVLRRPVELSSR